MSVNDVQLVVKTFCENVFQVKVIEDFAELQLNDTMPDEVYKLHSKSLKRALSEAMTKAENLSDDGSRSYSDSVVTIKQREVPYKVVEQDTVMPETVTTIVLTTSTDQRSQKTKSEVEADKLIENLEELSKDAPEKVYKLFKDESEVQTYLVVENSDDAYTDGYNDKEEKFGSVLKALEKFEKKGTVTGTETGFVNAKSVQNIAFANHQMPEDISMNLPKTTESLKSVGRTPIGVEITNKAEKSYINIGTEAVKNSKDSERHTLEDSLEITVQKPSLITSVTVRTTGSQNIDAVPEVSDDTIKIQKTNVLVSETSAHSESTVQQEQRHQQQKQEQRLANECKLDENQNKRNGWIRFDEPEIRINSENKKSTKIIRPKIINDTESLLMQNNVLSRGLNWPTGNGDGQKKQMGHEKGSIELNKKSETFSFVEKDTTYKSKTPSWTSIEEKEIVKIVTSNKKVGEKIAKKENFVSSAPTQILKKDTDAPYKHVTPTLVQVQTV